MLMRAPRWPALSICAPPPQLSDAARCKAFNEIQIPGDREELGIDFRELILHKPSPISGFALYYVCTSRASSGIGPRSLPNSS